MPFQIDNQIFLQVLVNGYDMPIADGSFSEFSMNENVRNKLPTIQFTYNDPSNFCGGTAGLVGGSSLVVTFGSARSIDPDPGQTVTYLVTGINVKIQGTKEIWTVNGVYNAPTYLAGLAQGAYPGNSHEAIGSLAGKCGLTLEADSGNDKMNWLPSRETYSDFIANIVDHAYAGASSIISHGVDDTGTLHVKDLQPLATSGATFTAFSGSPDQVKGSNIPMVGYEIISMDGLNNFTYNYGLKVVQEKLTGAANIIDSYAATQFSEFLSLSSSIQKAIGGDGVRSEYFPHDAGNTHENYAQAEYQNRRGKSLFSCRAEFTTVNCSGIHIYNVISFNPTVVSTNQVSTLWQGNYICTAKTKYISGKMYYAEKVEITSQGFGSNPGGSLVAG